MEAKGPPKVILQFFLTSEFYCDYKNVSFSQPTGLYSAAGCLLQSSVDALKKKKKAKKNPGRGCKNNGSNLFSQGPKVSLFCL